MSVPYHRLALALGGRWWTPLGGLAVIVGVLFAAGGVLGALSLLPGVDLAPSSSPALFDDPLVDLAATVGLIAIALPAALLAARLGDGRPAGTLSSVEGRLRWSWLRTCLGLALLAQVPLGLLSLGTAVLDEAPDWPGWGTVLPGLAVVVLLVPLQSAGEEYLFRGWLQQAAGRWLRSPWPPAVLLAALFTAGHGGSPAVLGSIFAFALLMTLLTIRTGGLEAAVALHVVTNVVGFTEDLVDGGFDASTGLNEGLGVLDALAGLATDVLFVGLVLWWLARRRPVRATAALAAS